jgi:hypothetical protein
VLQLPGRRPWRAHQDHRHERARRHFSNFFPSPENRRLGRHPATEQNRFHRERAGGCQSQGMGLGTRNTQTLLTLQTPFQEYIWEEHHSRTTKTTTTANRRTQADTGEHGHNTGTGKGGQGRCGTMNTGERARASEGAPERSVKVGKEVHVGTLHLTD